ncbi:ZMYM6 protein, partial [Polyodon spathula]|nr:ZMYM6 protein [Polyodon spathula]
LSSCKSGNLQRHFTTHHANIDQEFPKGTELCTHKLKTLKSQIQKKSQVFSEFTKHSQTVTLASYQVTWNIARAKKKTYCKGEFVKKFLADVISIVSLEDDNLKRTISDLQLLRRTVEHRISDINDAIESQLYSELQKSCDVQDKPQLAIFLWTVSDECVINEELLDIVPLKERTCGIDVKEALMAVVAKFWTFHCIIHQEQLVSETLNLDDIMNPVLEIVNFIHTKALNHRQFKMLIDELEDDLTLHRTVRWLSRGKVMLCFLELLDAVKLFMEEKHKDYPKLSDPQWLLSLWRWRLLLSLWLWRQNQQAFFHCWWRWELQVVSLQPNEDAGRRDSSHLEFNLLGQSHIGSQVIDHHGCRVHEGHWVEMLFPAFPTFPISGPQQVNKQWEVLPSPLRGTLEFWKTVPMDKYPNVKRAVLRLLSMFGSTCVCESFFSTLKHVKARQRSVLTGTHVKKLLRLASTEPDLNKIVDSKHCQKSH